MAPSKLAEFDLCTGELNGSLDLYGYHYRLLYLVVPLRTEDGSCQLQFNEEVTFSITVMTESCDKERFTIHH